MIRQENLLLKKTPNFKLIPSYMRNWLQQRTDILNSECLPSTEPQRNIQKERKDIEAYFAWTRSQFPDYMRALEKITQKEQSIQTEPGSAGVYEIGKRSLEPMNNRCRTSIVIPARKEGRVICHSLSEIIKQVDEHEQLLDPDIYEVTVLVNVAEQEKHDNTFDEILKFKHTHPQTHINVVEVKIQKSWANIGFVRKLANDLTLLRAVNRGGNYQEPLYLDMEDADLLEVDPHQVEVNIRLLDSNPALDAAVGYSDMMPSETIDNDFVYLNRSVDHLLRTHTKNLIHQIAPEKRNFDSTRLWTYGVNTVINAGSFALCGGCDWQPEVGEDLDLGKRISAMRGQVDKNGVFVPNIATIGFSGTTISSSPRRYFWELIKNSNGYDAGNFNNQEVRTIPLSELKAKAPYRHITPENIQRFQRMFYFSYEQLRFILPDKQLAQQTMYRVMVDLGFQPGDFAVEERRIILKNVGNIAQSLERKREVIKSGVTTDVEKDDDIESLYFTDKKNRHGLSETLIRNHIPLTQILEAFGNDYTAAERYYKKATGIELVTDPIGSLNKEISINKSCSVIIPVYNRHELISSLIALDHSSFAKKYPGQFEVIVIDDGSTKGDMNQVIQVIGKLNIKIRIVHQKNSGKVGALYTGAQIAQGDVVITIDPDYMPLPQTIEELMKRHQVLDDAILIGFRKEIDPAQVNDDNIGTLLANATPTFNDDVRFIGDNNFYETNWLKDAGNNTTVYDGHWAMRMSSFCHEVCRSASKQAILKAMAGYTPGVEYNPGDEILLQRLIAQGLYVIPTPSALGYHLSHDSNHNPGRSKQRRELMRSLAQQPVTPLVDNPYLQTAVTLYEKQYNPTTENNTFKNARMRFADISLLYYQTGLYAQANTYLQQALRIDKTSPELHALSGLLSIKSGDLQNAEQSILKAKNLKADHGLVAYAEGVLLLKTGKFAQAQFYLQKALKSNHVLARQYAEKYFRPNRIVEAKKYLEEAQIEPKRIESAITCLEAALVQDPNNQEAKKILEQVNRTT